VYRLVVGEHRHQSIEISNEGCSGEKPLLELAEDLTGNKADDIDSRELQEIVPLYPTKSGGSLESLERIVAKLTDDSTATTRMGTLFHVYDLRLADAHLASSETDATLRKLGLASLKL
jgi:hypothetical protein